MDRTIEVMQTRGRYFRNQIVTVVAVALTCITWAVIARAPRALLALSALIPACGVYCLADARLLQRWRSDLFEPWTNRELDLSALRSTLRVHPALPAGILEGMLGTLPLAGQIGAERAVSGPTRAAVAAAIQSAHRGRSDSILALSGWTALIVLVVCLAAWRHAPGVLAWLLLLCLSPASGRLLRRRGDRKDREAIGRWRSCPDFNGSDFTRLLESMPRGQEGPPHLTTLRGDG